MKNKILAIGPVTKDHIITPYDEYFQIGGAVYYQMMTLTNLKINATAIISIGKDDLGMLNNVLKKQKIILHEKTLEYTNIYDEKLNRTQKAKLPTNTIKKEDITPLDDVEYAILSPLSPEDIPPETIRYIKKNNVITVLVAQGYLRQTDKQGNIQKRQWPDNEKYLKYTDIICLDTNEAKLAFNIDNINTKTIENILNRFDLKQIIITRAHEGSTVYTRTKNYEIPAFKTENEVDATGLGDTYIASYIAKLQETKNINESGLFASMSAKEKLEHKGPLKTSKEKIEKELNKYR